MRRSIRRDDPDLHNLTPADLRRAVMKIRRQVRKVRDAINNNKCWIELVKLYFLLPEKKIPRWIKLPENGVISKEILKKNCDQYWKREFAMRGIGRLRMERKNKCESCPLHKLKHVLKKK